MAIATFSGRPRSQLIIPINLDAGDGTDGAGTGATGFYSTTTGVAATGDVYIGNFTTFSIADGVTLNIDKKFNLLLATGAVTLGGGTSGVITGTGNGPAGGNDNGGIQGPAPAGEGPGGGAGATGNDSNQGGGGGGGRADGTDGSIGNSPASAGGKQVGWLDYFLTGDLDMVGSGGGGGMGSTQINSDNGGAGGNGGAGLYIVSGVSITLKAGFSWTSNGNNGTTNTGGAGKGGGGGGGGGSCILVAPIITIDATSGTVISATGGTGGAGSSTGTGGAGSDGAIVLLYSRYYSVGGTVMSSTNLAARTNPDADTYAFAPYEMTGFGRRLRAAVPA